MTLIDLGVTIDVTDEQEQAAKQIAKKFKMK